MRRSRSAAVGFQELEFRRATAIGGRAVSGQLDASTFVTPQQRQRAFALALLMICGCVLTLPLSATQLPRFQSFILIADTAFALMSLVVSALLFGQVVMLRSRALLALA